MANATSNLMDSIENPNGRVSVKLQRNYFSKDSSDRFVGRAVRNTRTVGNVLQLVADKVPQLDIGTVYSVCDALEKVLTESLGGGNSVKCLNLGIFYIACRGTADGKTSSPEITVGFVPSERTKAAIEKLAVSQESYSPVSATISKITDIDTGTSGGEGGGIWLAPASNENGIIDQDGSDWKQVTAPLSVNTPGTLLFPLPKRLSAGTYRIVLKTRCTSSLKYECKEMMTTISEAIVIQ